MANGNSTGVVVVAFALAAALLGVPACGTRATEDGEATSTTPTAASRPQATGTLAFVALENGLSQLQLLRLDGSAIRTLTLPMPAILHVSWSPDGHSLAYEACEGGGSECESSMEVYVVDVDGGPARNISHNPAQDRFPAWAPDGARVAFVSDRSGNQDVYVMRRDGTGTTQLTHTNEFESSPQWSPGGQRIAFDRSDYTPGRMSTSIWSMAVDGTEPSRLAIEGTEPNWSPDGSLIAFHCPSDSYVVICTVQPDGTRQTTVTPVGADAFGYDWSMDGNLIAFTSNRDPDIGIYITCPVCAQPFTPKELSPAPSNDQDPVWSPDGTMIVYSTNGRLSIMSAAGASLARFAVHVLGPALWQPGGEATP